ncbi:phosphate ABC transporter substrate-binding/OmpA family protein [Pseudomonas sp. EL_65y_Pfl2_R95]|uniref:phosphate ABC transporter substrate-binding/OmpA family protein n=1 Tax=Pseudomonas sp. EL_65y_Pfl2_R95 TaxID=3088698 RepID=UPI0030D76B1B
MSCVLLDNDRDTWSRASTLILLGFMCYALPWSVFAAQQPAVSPPSSSAPLLRMQGSNTIGAKLGPALVKGMLEAQGYRAINIQPSGVENEQRVTATSAKGQNVRIDIAAHGSSTGFVGLQEGSADIAAASRPIKDAEVASLAGLGDMKSRDAEQVIAIDGLAIILHPSNPITSLRTDQLAQVFSGEISNWSQVGGKAGEIHLYARDDNSGTYDTFKELVLSANGKALSVTAKRFESNDKLSDTVSSDPQGIGFTGLPSIRQAKALAIASGESQPMLPTQATIATEDYPLSRRLFLYNSPAQGNKPWVKTLVNFAHSPRGQAIVAQNGFISQTVSAIKVSATPDMPPAYQHLANNAQRLSVNFRFAEGSANLDNKALRDLSRVFDFLSSQNKLHQNVVLVGFGDPKSDPARAELLSKLRAMAVRRELAKQGVMFKDIIGLGDVLPVAANTGEEGRIKNRRVEVWVY